RWLVAEVWEWWRSVDAFCFTRTFLCTREARTRMIIHGLPVAIRGDGMCKQAAEHRQIAQLTENRK
ncbi:MAG: hypothetical protein OXI59_12720, partial [Gemmatimonadota bacterium]|nr:hypothetical protein [Gemmatimonadota bacterium]